MSYYMGDYYTGDFYRGDPFLGGLLMRTARGVVGAAKGFLGLGGGSAAGAGMARISATAGTIVKRAGGIVAKHPVGTAAAAAGTIGVLGGVGAGEMMGAPPALMAPGGMRGFHMTKAVRHGARYNPAPHLAKNRRMRVTNPKALHRAIRRAHGFARVARKVLRFTAPKAPKGRMTFKTRRRSKR